LVFNSQSKLKTDKKIYLTLNQLKNNSHRACNLPDSLQHPDLPIPAFATGCYFAHNILILRVDFSENFYRSVAVLIAIMSVGELLKQTWTAYTGM